MRSKKTTWEKITDRMDFGLSAEHPIYVSPTPWTQPGPEALYDVHFELEVGIVLEGAVRRLYPDGHHRDFGIGELWIHGMWEPHGWTVLKPNTRLLTVMIWPPMLIDLHFPEAAGLRWMAPFIVEPQKRPVVPPPLRSEIMRIACALAAVGSPADERRDDSEPCMKSTKAGPDAPANDNDRNRLLSRLLLLHLLTLVLTDPQNNHLRFLARPTESQYLAPAIMLVFSSRDHVSVQAAAEACGMAESVFSRNFRDAMGVPFGQFGLRRRLSCAASQLTSTTHLVKQIAMDWGFSDESHFCRLFEQNYRCTPSRYRASATRKKHYLRQGASALGESSRVK